MFRASRARLRRSLFAAALAAATASAASAASVSDFRIHDFGHDAAGARAAQAAFLAGAGLANKKVTRHAVETFSDHKAWNGKSGTTNPMTKVGSFTSLGGKGTGSSAINGGTGLEVRKDSPFKWGRQNVASGLGGNWLDTNDTYGIRWNVGGVKKFNAIGFFLTDVADVGAKFSLEVGGTLYQNVIGAGGRTANGTIHWVSILLDEAVDSLVVKLRHDRLNDGFSIDGATVAHVAPVPVPPAILLMLTGGLALFGLRRRKAAA